MEKITTGWDMHKSSYSITNAVPSVRRQHRSDMPINIRPNDHLLQYINSFLASNIYNYCINAQRNKKNY